MSNKKTDTDQKISEKIEDLTTEPPMFKVLLFNDNFTTKAFVIEILMGVFGKSEAEAAQLMWHVHQNGIGVCGIYTFDIAETKITSATNLAREHDFPLRLSMEAE